MKGLSEFTTLKAMQPNELAAFEAYEFCKYNAGWERICDLKYDSSLLYVQWSDLTEAQKQEWENEAAYNEFAYTPCKVPYGFVLSDGSFVKETTVIPRDKGFMMLFQTSKLKSPGNYSAAVIKSRNISQYIFINPKELREIEEHLTQYTKHQAYAISVRNLF